MEVISPQSETPYQDVSPSAGVDDPKVEWNKLLDTARGHEYRGDPVQGLILREQMLLLAKKTFGDNAVEVQKSCESFVIRCNQIAMSKLKANQPNEAFDLLRKAEILTDKNGILALCPAARLRCRAVTFNNIGLFYRHRDQNNAALSYLEQALEIESGNSDFRSENPVATLLNLCAVLSKMGKYQTALSYARQALSSLNRHKKSKQHTARYGGETAPSHQTMFAVAHHAAGCQYEGLRNYQKAAEEYIAAIVASREADDSSSSVGRSYLHAYRSVIQKARASGRFSDASLPTLPPEKKRATGGLLPPPPPPTQQQPQQRRHVRQSLPQVNSAPPSREYYRQSRPQSASTLEPYKQPSLIDIQNAMHPQPQPPTKKRPSTGGTRASWAGNSRRPRSAKKAANYAYDLVYKPASVKGLSARNKQAFEELDEMTRKHLLRIAEEPLPVAPSPPQDDGPAEVMESPSPQHPPPSLREDLQIPAPQRNNRTNDVTSPTRPAQSEPAPTNDMVDEPQKVDDFGDTLQTLAGDTLPTHPTVSNITNTTNYDDIITSPSHHDSINTDPIAVPISGNGSIEESPQREPTTDLVEDPTSDDNKDVTNNIEPPTEVNALQEFLQIEADHMEIQQTTYSSPLAASDSLHKDQVAALAEALDRSIPSPSKSSAAIQNQSQDEEATQNSSNQETHVDQIVDGNEPEVQAEVEVENEEEEEDCSKVENQPFEQQTSPSIEDGGAVEKADSQKESHSSEQEDEPVDTTQIPPADLDRNSESSFANVEESNQKDEEQEEQQPDEAIIDPSIQLDEGSDQTDDEQQPAEDIPVQDVKLDELFGSEPDHDGQDYLSPEVVDADLQATSLLAKTTPMDCINYSRLSEHSGLGLLMSAMNVLPDTVPVIGVSDAPQSDDSLGENESTADGTTEEDEEARLTQERNHAALNVQRVWRGFLGNKQWKQIQLEVVTKKQQQRTDESNKQATVIQVMCKARLSVIIIAEKRAAKVLIGMRLLQARYRGYGARMRFRKIKDEWQERQKIIQFGSATRLQGWWRRMVARRQSEALYKQQWDDLIREQKPLYAIGRIKLWWKWLRFEHRLVAEVIKVTTENQRKKQILEEIESLQKLQHKSAVCIQQAYRKYISERQLEYRLMKDLTRKIEYLENEEREYSARVLQRFRRLVHAVCCVKRRRKELAEFAALKAWKQQKVAQQEAEMKVMQRLELAAIRIQKVWRGYSVRLKAFQSRLTELLEWEQSVSRQVTNIIRVWKGYSTRKKISVPLATHRLNIRQTAAIRVQKVGRGHQARNEMAAASHQVRSGLKIQRSFRAYNKRRNTIHSNTIQMFAQSAISIMKRSSKLSRQRAVLTLQRWCRSLQCVAFVREALKERRELRRKQNIAEYEECQAVLVQSLWRGFACRRKLKRRWAATIIQTAARCRLAGELTSRSRYLANCKTSLQCLSGAARSKVAQLRVAEMRKQLFDAVTRFNASIKSLVENESCLRCEVGDSELADRLLIRPPPLPVLKPSPPSVAKPPSASSAVRGLSEKGIRRYNAAVVVQKNWKTFAAKRDFKKLKSQPTKDYFVTIIQTYLRCRHSCERVRCLDSMKSLNEFRVAARRGLEATLIQSFARQLLSQRLVSQMQQRNQQDVEDLVITSVVGDIIKASILGHLLEEPNDGEGEGEGDILLTRPSLQGSEKDEVTTVTVSASIALLSVASCGCLIEPTPPQPQLNEEHVVQKEQIVREESTTSDEEEMPISKQDAALRIQCFVKCSRSQAIVNSLLEMKKAKHESVIQNEASTVISCCLRMWKAKRDADKRRLAKLTRQQEADRFDEEMAASTLIQSRVRGFIQRMKYNRMVRATEIMKKRRSLQLKLRERREKHRGIVRDEACTVIKNAFRRWIIMKDVSKKLTAVNKQHARIREDEASGSLGRWYKRQHAAGEIRKLRKHRDSQTLKEDAAVLIQSFFKGWSTRKRVRKQRQLDQHIHSENDFFEIQQFASKTLQSVGRAFLSRRHLAAKLTR